MMEDTMLFGLAWSILIGAIYAMGIYLLLRRRKK